MAEDRVKDFPSPTDKHTRDLHRGAEEHPDPGRVLGIQGDVFRQDNKLLPRRHARQDNLPQ